MVLEHKQNGSSGSVQSPGQDFRAQMLDAQKSGDFGGLIHNAKEAVDMFYNSVQTMRAGTFPGAHVEQAATIIKMLQQMQAQAEEQVAILKRTEKDVRDAFKAAKKNPQGVGTEPPPAQGIPEPVLPAQGETVSMPPAAPPLEVIETTPGDTAGWDEEGPRG